MPVRGPHASSLAALFAWCSFLLLPTPASAAAVHGTVVDPDGRPVPGANVHVVSLTGSSSTVTDAAGRYRVEALAPGRYRIIVEREGFRADPEPFALGEDDREIAIVLRLSAVSETVVVSAAQADAPLSSTPASVTVISGADLAARQVDTLADALREVPGLAVAQSGSRGALTSVFARGGESDYVLVLLDGVRLNAFGGGLDFANLAEANVERIEIVRGPQSALFGADAIGGVVHVVTRRGGPARGTALFEGGSQQTSRGSGSGAGMLGRLSWGAGAEWLGSSGLNGERAPSGEEVGNDDFDRRTASGSLAYARDAVRVRGAFHAGRTERGFPGPFGSDPNGTYPGIDLVSRGRNDWRSISTSADVPMGDRAMLRANVTWADVDGRFTSPFGVSDTQTRRGTARAQADLDLAPRAGFSAGVEIIDEQARSTFVTGETFEPIPVDRAVLGSFGELRLEPGNRVTLTAGARVERIHRDALQADPNPFSPRPAFPSDTVVSVNPRVAASWWLRAAGAASPAGRWASGWTRLHASAGTGIRPPDALEIAFTDNPALRPERSRSVDAGLEQAFWQGALVVDATFFHNRYDDLIVAVGRSFADASQYRTDNISNARATGLELAVWTRPDARIEMRGSYTLLDTAVLAVDGSSGAAPPPFGVGDPLIRRPRHRATWQASLTWPRWSVFGRVEARGRALDVDPTLGAFGGTVVGPGYALVDLGGAWRAWRATELFARTTNLFDRDYEEVVGFPNPGRAFLAGIRLAPGH